MANQDSDIVPSIGLDDSARHSTTGKMIYLNGDDESVLVKSAGTIYEASDYSYSWNSKRDRRKLELHAVTVYKDYIENIVDWIASTGNNVRESNFENGFCESDDQCKSDDCGYDLTSVDRCCFIACWNCNRQTHHHSKCDN